MKVLEVIEAKMVNNIKYMTIKVEVLTMFSSKQKVLQVYSEPIAGDIKHGYVYWKRLNDGSSSGLCSSLEALFQSSLTEDFKFKGYL